MTEARRSVGRPRRYAQFEQFEESLPTIMTKRALYCDGIGLFQGAKSSTAWVKIRLRHGGTYKGKTMRPGEAVEIKLGNRTSFDWAQLIAERDRLQGLADRGEVLEAEEVPFFASYSTAWLDRKKATLKSFGVTKGHIESVFIPTFGNKALNAITMGDVNRWIGSQSATLKPSSVKRQLNTFNAVMNDAVRNGYIERNPAERADKIKGIEARLRFVTDEDWQTILRTAEKIEADQEGGKDRTPHQIRGWLKHFVVFAYNSGMRRTEILDLTFDQVRTVAAGHTVIEVVNTKTGKPRFVTCTPEMETIIRALRGQERISGDNRLFPVSMTTLKRSLTRLWKATGLKDVRLHDLRRTHATILISQNVDPRTVAGRLGHSGTGMLARHYAVNRGDIEAAQGFGDRVRPLDERAKDSN